MARVTARTTRTTKATKATKATRKPIFGLPTTKEEVSKYNCEDMNHAYTLLSNDQKKKWIRAAAVRPGGAIRLQSEGHLIIIWFWDQAENSYTGCQIKDSDILG